MADVSPQSDDNTQSFVVRAWHETPGHVRGTVRHVQSKDHRGFTRLNQAQEFMEQRLAGTASAPSPVARSARSAPQPPKVSIFHQRKFLMATSALVILVAAGLTVIASSSLPGGMFLGSAVGSSSGLEVILALVVGLVLGSLGSALWLRRSK